MKLSCNCNKNKTCVTVSMSLQSQSVFSGTRSTTSVHIVSTHCYSRQHPINMPFLSTRCCMVGSTRDISSTNQATTCIKQYKYHYTIILYMYTQCMLLYYKYSIMSVDAPCTTQPIMGITGHRMRSIDYQGMGHFFAM